VDAKRSIRQPLPAGDAWPRRACLLRDADNAGRRQTTATRAPHADERRAVLSIVGERGMAPHLGVIAAPEAIGS